MLVLCSLTRATLAGLTLAALAPTSAGAASRPAPAPAAPIRLSVDAREAPRRILHARLQVPVKPGPLTLLYPKWIPGEHGPTGPIASLAVSPAADGKRSSGSRAMARAATAAARRLRSRRRRR